MSIIICLNFLSRFFNVPEEYEECLYIFDNYFRKEELQLNQRYFVAKIVRIISRGTKEVLCTGLEEQKIYDEIKANPEIIDDNNWLFKTLNT